MNFDTRNILRVTREPLWGNCQLYLIQRRNIDGLVETWVAEATSWKRVQQDTVISPSATFEFADQQAQELMDELWGCGFRPKEGSGSSGSLAATEHHLRDLQRIVFKDCAKEERK